MITKYKSKKVVIDGIKFDSIREGEYYIDMKDKGIDINIQPKYELQPKFLCEGQKIQPIIYIADFSFMLNGVERVIDIKGMPTEGAKLKRKMFMYKYPEKKLSWMTKYKGEWVGYFENEKRRKETKRQKLADSFHITKKQKVKQ